MNKHQKDINNNCFGTSIKEIEMNFSRFLHYYSMMRNWNFTFVFIFLSIVFIRTSRQKTSSPKNK